jgi:hypothetical protein
MAHNVECTPCSGSPTLHAINRVSVRGVDMACNTPNPLRERAPHLFPTMPTAEGDVACNTLPYKIAALREAHRSGHSAALVARSEADIHLQCPAGFGLASAKLYDPASRTFGSAGSLQTARSYHYASLMNPRPDRDTRNQNTSRV